MPARTFKDFSYWWNLMKPLGLSGFLTRKNNEPIGGLLFSHINDIIFKKKEIHNLNTHLEYLEKIINQNLKNNDKRIIVFLVKEPHQNLIYKKEKNFANFEFVIIDTVKEHFFIIDDHLNVNGHKYIAKRLANYLSK